MGRSDGGSECGRGRVAGGEGGAPSPRGAHGERGAARRTHSFTASVAERWRPLGVREAVGGGGGAAVARRRPAPRRTEVGSARVRNRRAAEATYERRPPPPAPSPSRSVDGRRRFMSNARRRPAPPLRPIGVWKSCGFFFANKGGSHTCGSLPTNKYMPPFPPSRALRVGSADGRRRDAHH